MVIFVSVSHKIHAFFFMYASKLLLSIWTCQLLSQIGQGTYSSVFRARNLDTGKIVALKKVRFDNFEPESVRFMAREITILRRLDHPNIIKLEGLIASRLSCSIYLVFEYMEHDIAGLLSCPDIEFSEAQVCSCRICLYNLFFLSYHSEWKWHDFRFRSSIGEVLDCHLCHRRHLECKEAQLLLTILKPLWKLKRIVKSISFLL